VLLEAEEKALTARTEDVSIRNSDLNTSSGELRVAILEALDESKQIDKVAALVISMAGNENEKAESDKNLNSFDSDASDVGNMGEIFFNEALSDDEGE
jgi:hypothetical protein